MATMDMLIKEIYFEKQEAGSMLCAQHALNSLLQGEYFTAPDLATIARQLDQLEEGVDDSHGERSTNMDDTGFFSIQVLEEALKPWGLSLQRWRSATMQPYHDNPHRQLAFILNSAQHWYTLRRFGGALSDFRADPGVGHWFDLNSSLAHPKWVGKLYLGMTIQQAEDVGYSVFAVVQDDPSKPIALPRSDADHIAEFVTEDARPSAAYRSESGPISKTTQTAKSLLSGFDDEDADLQAALQASIEGNAYRAASSFEYSALGTSGSSTPSAATSSGSRAPFRSRYDGSNLATQQRRDVIMVEDDDDDDLAHPPVIPAREAVIPVREPMADLDPVAASRARNEAYMRQVMREQEAALRETRSAEIAQIQAGQRARRRDTRQEQEEAELQRAIEASRALHEASSGPAVVHDASGDVELADVEEVEFPETSGLQGQDRVYDDDDAELQAALQASLADAPSGFVVPLPPAAARAREEAYPAAERHEARSGVETGSGGVEAEHEESVIAEETETETGSEAETSVAEEEAEQVSVEELRRRRLARFGG